MLLVFMFQQNSKTTRQVCCTRETAGIPTLRVAAKHNIRPLGKYRPFL